MDAVQTLKEVGWIGILIIWAMDKFFPRLWTFLTDKFFPSRALERAKKIQQGEDDARARREADAALLKAKIEQEMRQEEHRRKMEERTTTAIEQMSLAITVLNERVSHLTTSLSAHDKFTVDAVGEMRETVIKMHKRDTQRKIKAIRKAKT